MYITSIDVLNTLLYNGTLAKAALVGAKTVNVPGPARVSARPAALTAASRVEKFFSSAITSSAMLLLATRGAGLGGEEGSSRV